MRAWLRRHLNAVGYLVMATGFMFALWRVDAAADDARHSARVTQVEAERNDAERCRVTLVRQDRSMEKDIQIFTGLGHRLQATQADIDEFVHEVIEPAYDRLPTPADCQQEDEGDP